MLRSGIKKICRAVILADDSALWKVAGLRQLERLALAVNELAVARGEEVELCVLWSPDFPQSQKFLPRHPRLLPLSVPHGAAGIRRCPPQHSNFSAIAAAVHSGLRLNPKNTNTCRRTSLNSPMKFARPGRGLVRPKAGTISLTPAQVAACERRFLRRGGKSQDGLVSRFINRPISRAVSRVLLKTPITPSAWTLAIFALPLVGAAFLVRGDYANVLARVGRFPVLRQPRLLRW